jgi:putative acetyltransferase
MKIVDTDGENKDFIRLCELLDDNLNELVGGEKQRAQYVQYNHLTHIHDVFIMYDNEYPIACASFKHYEKGIAEVKRVFVRKEYRGQGISKQLLIRLEEKAKEKGYHRLILETGKMLREANELYKNIGYEIIENYGQYKDMNDSVCMQKDL